MSVGRVSSFGPAGSTAVARGRGFRARRRRCASLALWRTAITLPVAGCNHSPTLDLCGSYFPAWMLCAAVGIVASVIIRQILAVVGVNTYVVAPLLTYAALAVLQVETGLQQYDAAIALQTASDVAFHISSDSYAAGVGTFTDVVSAQTGLAAARSAVRPGTHPVADQRGRACLCDWRADLEHRCRPHDTSLIAAYGDPA